MTNEEVLRSAGHDEMFASSGNLVRAMTQPDLIAVLDPRSLPAYRLQQPDRATRPGRELLAPLAALPEGWTRTDVGRLIIEQRFTLAFQPVLRLSDRTCLFHEAFLRPRLPSSLPPLSAGRFVHLAECSGLAAMLDVTVMELALSEAAGQPVSINVCAETVADPALAGRIMGQGGNLWLEMHPHGPPPPDLTRQIAALRAIGAHVCLDGLTAEPDQLEWVRAARFDLIKFDGALTRAATAADRNRRLLAALVRLARVAGAQTVAKRIETLPQAWLMQELGVDYGQGWLFGAPGSLDVKR